ncbi:DNA cytosine methyltransferase [Ruminiclostridium papyrosolvens]|uniref:Cytosine-specific methyltransferase n=1 Tax=Ruminiclostridium papyrosolvens C7 TaxID=1330534 RepID=U4QWS5_9FIRM|nr:DNA cytosine methyltransferase [Ruminiclostridium papyrosolvens]EPR07799.1 hypothetical protein L323_20100 [Ruminiclostridium papyrosolvens C7]
MGTTIELFSGPGGLGLGFHMAGFKTLAAFEYEDDCINTYKANFPETYVEKKDLKSFSETDIESLKEFIRNNGSPLIDVVMGGPPCRSFSTSNSKREHGDHRDYLYKSLVYVASQLNAKYFIMENVEDILSKSVEKGNSKKVFHRLLEDLQIAGFHYINFKILKSADYGVPQTRERIIIIATKDPNLQITYPKPTHYPDREPKWISVSEAFEDLPKVTSPSDNERGANQELLHHVGKNYVCYQYASNPRNDYTRYCRGFESSYGYLPFPWTAYDPNQLSLFIVPEHKERIIERYSLLEEDENQGDLVKRLKSQLSEEQFQNLLKRQVIPKKIFVQKNRKLPANIPARTVTSHAREELVHPDFNRNLTAREVARLQGFPDWYKITGDNQKPYKGDPDREIGAGRDYYQQLGDAVPPLMAAAIAKEVKKNIEHSGHAKNAELRKLLVKYIYSHNIKIQDVMSKFKINNFELSDILSGIVEIPTEVIDKISSKIYED